MGVIPRSVHAIFEYLDGISADYTVRTSFLELYNEASVVVVLVLFAVGATVVDVGRGGGVFGDVGRGDGGAVVVVVHGGGGGGGSGSGGGSGECCWCSLAFAVLVVYVGGVGRVCGVVVDVGFDICVAGVDFRLLLLLSVSLGSVTDVPPPSPPLMPSGASSDEPKHVNVINASLLL